jgi:hypothetical protein
VEWKSFSWMEREQLHFEQQWTSRIDSLLCSHLLRKHACNGHRGFHRNLFRDGSSVLDRIECCFGLSFV